MHIIPHGWQGLRATGVRVRMWCHALPRNTAGSCEIGSTRGRSAYAMSMAAGTPTVLATNGTGQRHSDSLNGSISRSVFRSWAAIWWWLDYTIKSFINCATTWVIYSIQCPCNKMYIGKSKRQLCILIGEHLRHIRQKEPDSPLAQYFLHYHQASTSGLKVKGILAL